MTIAYNGTITITSTMTDGVVDPTTNLLHIVETSGPSMRKFNLSTLTQSGSNITVQATVNGIAMINSASSVTCGPNGSPSVDFVENATGYRTNVTTGAITSNNTGTRSQKMAADPAAGIAFYVGNAANTLGKIVGSTQTLSSINLRATGQPTLLCIIYKSSGRFLVGGQKGHIYEIDTSGNVVDELLVTVEPNSGLLQNTAGTALQMPTIAFMSYDNNILLVSTDDSIMCYDYSTKTKLWEDPVGGGSTNNTIVLCASASGETLLSYNGNITTDNVVKEINFTTYAPTSGDTTGTTFWTDSANNIIGTGYSPNTSQGYAIQPGVSKVRVFTVTPNPTTIQTFTLPAPYTSARLLILDDTNGVGTIKRVLDTYMVSGNSYRIPTGKTLVGFVKMYTGTNAFWCESRVST